MGSSYCFVGIFAQKNPPCDVGGRLVELELFTFQAGKKTIDSHRSYPRRVAWCNARRQVSWLVIIGQMRLPEVD